MKNTDSQKLLTIDELAAEVASTIAGVGQASGRVSEVPSRRTIRYYSTHGLLDRPLEFRGRTALYGRKHVLQLVVIKRMQARGLALSEIQTRMFGATDAELLELAGQEPTAEPLLPPKPDDNFWNREPSDSSAAQPAVPEAALQISGIRLDPNIVLMIEDATRELHADDLAAIRVAAEPLMKLLRARHLVHQPRSEDQ